MQFSISTIVALAISVSLASAAPATSNARRQSGCPGDAVTVTLQGADPASDFPVCVYPTGHAVPSNNNYLEISSIFYDTSAYECSFTAQFDDCDCPAKATYVYGDNVVTVGPPQLITGIACSFL